MDENYSYAPDLMHKPLNKQTYFHPWQCLKGVVVKYFGLQKNVADICPSLYI